VFIHSPVVLNRYACTAQRIWWSHPEQELSKERHEQELASPHAVANKKFPQDDMPVEAKQFMPKPGDFMLYTGFATKSKPFHLVKVMQFVEETEEVEFQ
jgi:hypothetical protein